jgi:DNA repair protein RAD5
LEDLYGLIKYLRVEPWCIFSHWNQNVAAVWNEEPAAGLAALHGILGPLMLRRTKNTIGKDGTPIVTLPSSSIEIKVLDFDEAEQEFYDAIDARSKKKFTDLAAGGNLLSNFANILELLLRLRQACDHPMLTVKKATGGADGSADGSGAGGEKDAGSGGGAAGGHATSDHAFEDIDELIARFNQHGEGSAKFASEVSEQIKFALGGGGGSIVTASGVGGGAVGAGALPDAMECPICLDEPDDTVILPCLHTGCRECLTSVIARVHYCPVCRKPMEPSDAVGVKVGTKSPYFDKADSAEEQEDDGSGAGARKRIKSRDDTSTRVKPGGRVRGGSGGGGAWKASTKLDAVAAHIKAMIAKAPTDKCIIFSQWTSMLDLVERILEDHKVVAVRLDGSLSQPQRVVALDKFKSDATVNVLVMSLRAGGVGLNLSAASHVILIDPWWNPAVEEQAIDRVHRIGQKKAVTVSRFIMRGSVEERILELQTEKKMLASAAMSKADSKERKQERIDNLRLLFGLSNKKKGA